MNDISHRFLEKLYSLVADSININSFILTLVDYLRGLKWDGFNWSKHYFFPERKIACYKSIVIRTKIIF